MADSEKRGGDGNTKIEYLDNEKSFLDETKTSESEKNSGHKL